MPSPSSREEGGGSSYGPGSVIVRSVIWLKQGHMESCMDTITGREFKQVCDLVDLMDYEKGANKSGT